MKFDKSTVKIVEECAKLLEKIGKTPFTRQDIICLFKWKYPRANEDTINPTIQAITDNLQGGAPDAINRKILHSVGDGLFEILRTIV